MFNRKKKIRTPLRSIKEFLLYVEKSLKIATPACKVRKNNSVGSIARRRPDKIRPSINLTIYYCDQLIIRDVLRKRRLRLFTKIWLLINANDQATLSEQLRLSPINCGRIFYLIMAQSVLLSMRRNLI